MPSPTSYTSNDLILKVLSKLGVAAVGQFVAPEDFEKVNVNLNAIFRKIAALEIVYIADPTNIPAEWFQDLASIVTGEVAYDFGARGPDLAEAINAGLGGAAGTPVPIGGGTAAMSFKIMLRGRPTGEEQRTHSY